MAEDTIIVDIDDSQLSDILMQIQLLGVTSEKTVGSRRLDLALPGINREMRLILGQFPFMRDFMRGYFGLRRLERAKAYLQLGETLPAYLAIIATAVIIIRQFQRQQEMEEQRRREYEMFIRRERGFSHDQYLEWKRLEDAHFRGRPG